MYGALISFMIFKKVSSSISPKKNSETPGLVCKNVNLS